MEEKKKIIIEWREVENRMGTKVGNEAKADTHSLTTFPGIVTM